MLLKVNSFSSSLFFNVYNENMFTIEIEDGRDAQKKPSYLQMIAA